MEENSKFFVKLKLNYDKIGFDKTKVVLDIINKDLDEVVINYNDQLKTNIIVKADYDYAKKAIIGGESITNFKIDYLVNVHQNNPDSMIMAYPLNSTLFTRKIDFKSDNSEKLSKKSVDVTEYINF